MTAAPLHRQHGLGIGLIVMLTVLLSAVALTMARIASTDTLSADTQRARIDSSALSAKVTSMQLAVQDLQSEFKNHVRHVGVGPGNKLAASTATRFYQSDLRAPQGFGGSTWKFFSAQRRMTSTSSDTVTAVYAFLPVEASDCHRADARSLPAGAVSGDEATAFEQLGARLEDIEMLVQSQPTNWATGASVAQDGITKPAGMVSFDIAAAMGDADIWAVSLASGAHCVATTSSGQMLVVRLL